MLGLARVRDRRARSDRCAAIRALGELFGARGAGEEVVARPEDDGPRRVGLHADRAEEAVLQRLLLALDLDERAGGRVRRGLRLAERLWALRASALSALCLWTPSAFPRGRRGRLLLAFLLAAACGHCDLLIYWQNFDPARSFGSGSKLSCVLLMRDRGTTRDTYTQASDP